VSPVPSPGANGSNPVGPPSWNCSVLSRLSKAYLAAEAREQQQPVVHQVLQPRAEARVIVKLDGLAFGAALLGCVELAVQGDQLEGVDAAGEQVVARIARHREREVGRLLLLARAEQPVVEVLQVDRREAEQVEVARAHDRIEAVGGDRVASPLRLTSRRSSSSLYLTYEPERPTLSPSEPTGSV
jgi:hypothetical protein